MKRLLLLSIVMFAFGGMIFAQSTDGHDVTMNVVDIALIDVNTDEIILELTAPAQGGLDPVGETDATKYLQYTSLVDGATTRQITIEWGGTDAAPAGTRLLAEVIGISGGSGTRGTAGAQVVVSDTAQAIINSIGSCVTGVGATDGANVEFTFDVQTPGSLVVGDSETVTIVYTLTTAS